MENSNLSIIQFLKKSVQKDLSTHSVKYFKAFALTYNIHGQEAQHLDIDRQRPERSFSISNDEGIDW